MAPPSPVSAGDQDPRRWPVRREVSAGGVVVRPAGSGYDVVLVRPRTDDDREVWALPKGLVERGESPEVAALREVLEEAGVTAEIVQPLEDLHYWYTWAPDRVRVRKTVHLYLMRALQVGSRHADHEIAEVRMVPLSAAPAVATYRSERKALQRGAGLVSLW